ncbi:uncharacterized protein LOC135323175 [Camelus dromedarius]|uniref:uncharacterized protein LOC135323175 n=1 Tax=Camelus dromedarius TaxID=9838 RepID=UPI003119D46A
MSHFTNWKVSQVSKSSLPCDNVRKRAMCKDLTARRFSPRPPGTDWKLPTPLGPVYPPSISGQTATKAVGRSWELSPPTGKSFQIHDVTSAHLPQQGPFRHFMDMKAEKRLAGRKERRSRFGDINVHKCYQFGQVFRPFQALASTVLTKGFYFTYLHFLSTYQQRKSGTYPVPFREGPMEEQGWLCTGASEGLTSVLPNPGTVFSFTPGGAFHPDPCSGKALDNCSGRQSRLTDCRSRCLDGGSHHRGLA